MSKTSLTFYGGVNEIGGNKILLEDKDTRVFLDFGKSFSRRAKYFEEFLNPRTANGIVDFLTMGLIPDISGVYRDDLMVMAGRKPQKPEIDAVLLTHAHADHADYISFLHEDITIYTSEGPIVYTGDFRLHGTHPDMTRDFIEKAKKVKPIALISEGTRIADKEKEESEKLVYEQSSKTVSESDNLVFADFNFKDVDRMRTFFKIAKENDRKFVVKINDAYFLKYLSQDKHLDVPNIDDEDIIVYLPKRGSGTYSEKDYKGNDKEFLDLHNTWTAEQIASRPNKVLCAIGFYSFTALIDMKPKSGARYIHSASEPYNEEQELSLERIDAWIEHFGMSKFQSHCSGHARGRDLLEAVAEIGAKTLYPVHTEHPDLYKKISKNLVMVQEGMRYNL